MSYGSTYEDRQVDSEYGEVHICKDQTSTGEEENADFFVEIVYEKLPVFCVRCCDIGHSVLQYRKGGIGSQWQEAMNRQNDNRQRNMTTHINEASVGNRARGGNQKDFRGATHQQVNFRRGAQ